MKPILFKNPDKTIVVDLTNIYAESGTIYSHDNLVLNSYSDNKMAIKCIEFLFDRLSKPENISATVFYDSIHIEFISINGFVRIYKYKYNNEYDTWTYGNF